MRIVQFTLLREQKEKIGEVETVKVLKDGKLMAICKSGQQKNKALHIDNVYKKPIAERRIVCENKVSRGVITGVPVD